MELLSLSDEEEEVLSFDNDVRDETQADQALCLIGRFLTNKRIKNDVMKERMATLWKLGRKVAIKEIDKGLNIFQFFHKIDMQRVLQGEPWTFDGILLILSAIETGGIPSHIPLFHASFWVQVHDLPTGMMTKKVGEGLGKFLGEMIEYDAKNTSNFWRTYMRIRVKIDVQKPLKRGKKIDIGNGNTVMLRFKYERLALFCYLCGLLGHSDQYCEKLFTMEEDDGVRRWGPELRVDRRKGMGSSSCQWLCEEHDLASEETRSASSQPVPPRQTGTPQQHPAAPQFTGHSLALISEPAENLMRRRNLGNNRINHLQQEINTINGLNNTQLTITNGINEELMDDEEVLEKKRKRTVRSDESIDGTRGNADMMDCQESSTSAMQNFLGVGPGFQAHQDQ
jgi:14-3-3 protein epsilon